MIDENLGMLWGHPKSKQDFQQFAEEGVEYFNKKYGYIPTELQYRVEDGIVRIPGITCIAVISNHQRQTIMLLPAPEHD